MKGAKGGLKVAKTVLQVITRRLNGFSCCPVISSCKNRWRQYMAVATLASEQTQQTSGTEPDSYLPPSMTSAILLVSRKVICCSAPLPASWNETCTGNLKIPTFSNSCTLMLASVQALLLQLYREISFSPP